MARLVKRRPNGANGSNGATLGSEQKVWQAMDAASRQHAR
jgi:hypothetical protein